MFRNYFKTAWRNLGRQKMLALINIIGLSVGIACFTLFTLYAINEFNYDNFHQHKDNIYRVYVWSQAKGGEAAHGITYQPMPLGPAMKTDLPDVENYVRIRGGSGESFIKTGNSVNREEICFADPSFFSVFSFKILSGSPEKALQDLHSIVLTRATADRLFGNTAPVGKVIRIKIEDAFEPFTVTAIAENPPSNSSIQFKMLANFNYLTTTRNGAKRANNWNQYSYQTYVRLKPGSRLLSGANTLIAFRKKYYPDEETKSRADGWTGKGPRNYYGLQPLTAMHTDVKITGGLSAPIDPATIWILLSIATGVLLIACINFTTLAIGRSAGRAAEIGVRKVMGSTQLSLVKQFMVEAWLLAFLSTVLGVILARCLLPFFNDLSGTELRFSFIQFPQLAGMLIGVVLLVGLLAGSYPALVLSGFNPVEALQRKVKLGGSNLFTRSLVTLQFVLSAALIISTVIIMQQLHYMQSKYPGFDKENVVVVDAEGISDTKTLYALFRQRLASDPGIIGTASADLGIGGNEGWSESWFKYNGKDKYVYEYFIDPDYMRVLGLKLLAGRNFDPAVNSDTVTSVIINEAMMHDFGWTMQNAVGQKLNGYFDDKFDPKTPTVIGVVKDFNYLGFNTKVEPQLFQQFSSYRPYKFFVRIQPGNPAKALAAIQQAWKAVAADYPEKYEFLDEDLDRFYKAEAKWSNIVGWAGGISVFLACLGLLGLSALAVVNRTREISIRKVLGASIASILALLSRDFVRLVLIAIVIATPVTWYFMNRWLEDYAYRIHIGWWVFATTAALMILIALLTVSFQAIKAACASPTSSLR